MREPRLNREAPPAWRLSIPKLLMLGVWPGLLFSQTALICAAGGILSVLHTIALQRMMVVKPDLAATSKT